MSETSHEASEKKSDIQSDIQSVNQNASDSEEIQATTFVIDGVPMSLSETIEYRAAKKQEHEKREDEAREIRLRTIKEDDEERRKIRAERGI